MKRTVSGSLVRYGLSTCAVAVLVAGYFHQADVNETTVAMSFLLVILLAAANWGLRHAIYLSVLSSAAFNFFFLPPVLTFTIRDSRNWVALFTFLLTGIVASQLAERARSEAAISRARQREAERISDLSQQMMVSGNVIDLLNELPHMIATTFNLAGAALYLREKDRTYRSHPNYMDISAAELRDAAFTRDHRVEEHRGITVVPILLGMRPIGSLGATRSGPEAEARTSRVALEAVAALAAIAIERAGAVETLTKLEASRESERLRNALLDSVAHELRTPLTSITAAISTLRSDDGLGATVRDDLMQVIEEEAGRLDRLVGQAMEMAELDAHDIQLDPKPHSMREAVDGAVETEMAQIRTHPVDVRIADSLPKAMFDLERIQKVLQHLLRNAARYSAEGSPIFISAEVADGHLITSVADRGVGVDDLERSMIFDKFYRGQGQRYRVQGTGMGLAISKAIVEAHHGTIEMTSQPGAWVGVFVLAAAAGVELQLADTDGGVVKLDANFGEQLARPMFDGRGVGQDAGADREVQRNGLPRVDRHDRLAHLKLERRAGVVA